MFLFFIAYNVVTSACIPVYSSLTFLYASCLRYLSVGFVFSLVGIGATIFIIIFYAIRECYVSSASQISSTCLSIIFSEAMLFVGYFWGAYHFFLSVGIEREGILAPSTRLLIHYHHRHYHDHHCQYHQHYQRHLHLHLFHRHTKK